MLKAEQVPDEAYRAWREAFFSDSGGRAAIAAAINAWPGIIETEIKWKHPNGAINAPSLILPLTENTNAES